MRLQHKSFPATEVKTLDEDQGLLEAIVSVFGIEDMGGDRVLPGAFVESLARRKPYGCLYHQWERPVAKTLEAKELPAGDPLLPESIRQYGGLYVKAQFNLETQDGKEAFSNLKSGLLDQFSIGFSVDPDGKRKTKSGVNELTKLTLYEWSPVLWGMNPATVPLSVKTLEAKGQYLGDYAAESMTLAALRDACDSLFYRAIYGILYEYDGALTAAEKVEAIDAAISEFHALAVACLRAMLTIAEGDEDAASEMEAEYKQVFAVPARTAGRFDHQLLALLTEAEGAIKRADEISALRESKGRSLFSAERRAQLATVNEAFTRLFERTAPRPEPLEPTLLQLQADFEATRLRTILRSGGAM